uniref:Uncharacterized protein n=1 Tax=Heterorhabditis bacteriophora TaxID=37862 RepID=A0A1I7X2X2_HETBA
MRFNICIRTFGGPCTCYNEHTYTTLTLNSRLMSVEHSSPNPHEKINRGASYRIAAYFYDGKTTQLFGCPYHTSWYISTDHECTIEDNLFFHCPKLDDNVYLILEIVENDNGELITVAWGKMNIGRVYAPIAEYSKVPQGMDIEMQVVLFILKLNLGSPKILTFSSHFDGETTSSGVLHCSLYSHKSLLKAVDYFPDYCIVGNQDDIPGLRNNNRAVCSYVFPFFSHLKIIKINTDRLYRENGTFSGGRQSMQVIERRLRISMSRSLLLSYKYSDFVFILGFTMVMRFSLNLW